jgi:hypothetical protein
MWHCPNCGVPQAESARCWVCRRSSTTCSTCRHFQRSLAADVGYCGLDSRRTPLTGLELRGCWEARTHAAEEPAVAPPPDRHRLRPGIAAWEARSHREFVPLDDAGAPDGPRASPGGSGDTPQMVIPEALDDWSDRRSLFGDAEV